LKTKIHNHQANNPMPKITTVTINTKQAFEDIFALDRQYIGSSAYMGLAYFWNYDFRHYLRDASQHQRKLVHQQLLKANLSLNGSSAAHEQIISKVLKIKVS